MNENLLREPYPFVRIPNWVQFQLGLSDKALRVYAAIASFADNESRKAYPKLSTIAELAGCSPRTVTRVIAELVEAGAINSKAQVFNSGQTSNLYVLPMEPTHAASSRMSSPPSHACLAPLDTGVYPPSSPVSSRKLDSGELHPVELDPRELTPPTPVGGRARRPRDIPWNDETHRPVLHARFSGKLTPSQVDLEIDKALNHKAADRYHDIPRYVGNWLQSTVARNEERQASFLHSGKTNGRVTPAGSPPPPGFRAAPRPHHHGPEIKLGEKVEYDFVWDAVD